MQSNSVILNGYRQLWTTMAVDEYASFEKAQGLRLNKVQGIWWVEIRPFFFRPLMPYDSFVPDRKKYPLKSLIGGVQHAVPRNDVTNSNLKFFIYDDLQNYSLKILSSNRRKKTKKAEKNFYYKKIENISEFVNDAFDIYTSFYKRTYYKYKEERLDIKYFRSWAETLFNFPKVLILGIYYLDKLSAVSISYLVEDYIIAATFFSDTHSLKLDVTDYTSHIVRTAASHTKAKYIIKGPPTGIKTLDDSKLKRGCKLLNLSAYYKINPAVEILLKVFLRNTYNKLLGNFKTIPIAL